MLTRRQFLERGALIGGVGSIAPTFLWRAQVARGSSEGVPASVASGKTLVIVQMAGGNDGLNTVVPYSDSTYLSVRPTLYVDPATVLQLNDRLGLNPALSGLKKLWDANQLAIIEGVGYPNPSYSHFDSMAIWQTAAPKGEFADGWLGRYFKQSGADANAQFAGIDIGGALAPMLRISGVTIPVVQNPGTYRLALDPRDTAARLDAWQDMQTAAQARSKYLPLISSAALNARSSTQALGQALSSYQPAVNYGKDPLSGSLRVLASVISQEPGTKIGYATIGGFDTHTNERRSQDTLLTTLSDALSNFQADLAAHGKADDVLVVTWTEFGRRVRENASEGTDHGDGGTMFVIGSGVKQGIFGDVPDLTKLDPNGSVMWSTDFRSVYATLLENWLGVDSTPILGGRFAPLPFLAAAQTGETFESIAARRPGAAASGQRPWYSDTASSRIQSPSGSDGIEGTSDVIVRVLHEGQYELEDAAKARLGELDEDVFKAVVAGNANRYHELFAQVLQVIRDQGKPLAADDLRPSDLILPAPDSTMVEVKSLLEQEGLISAP